jgi:hypothetical protein
MEYKQTLSAAQQLLNIVVTSKEGIKCGDVEFSWDLVKKVLSVTLSACVVILRSRSCGPARLSCRPTLRPPLTPLLRSHSRRLVARGGGGWVWGGGGGGAWGERHLAGGHRHGKRLKVSSFSSMHTQSAR